MPRDILDVACGTGWLANELDYSISLDGIDAFETHPIGYRKFFKYDLNDGLPTGLGLYDAVVICEAMAYFQNPGVLIKQVREHLKVGGVFIISDPNPLYIGARINYLLQGFPRSHSSFSQNNTIRAHMPWANLGLFQYWLLLGLNGFVNIQLHDVGEKKPKRPWEKLFGPIVKAYCNNKVNKALSDNEKNLWRMAASEQNIYGRRLVISAEAS